MSRIKIGVFDSGVGGLTVLKTLINKCPNHEYIYYGDTLHIPYGEKSKDEVIGYANNIVKFLENMGCEAIVIACGTISSNIEYVKSNVLLIDLLSPLTNMLDKYKKISIIATPLSIKTNAYQKYINTQLNLISTPLLVPIIESMSYENLDEVLKEYLKDTLDSDALLLGCTHYPIIKDYIKKYFKKDIICLDDYILKKIDKLKTSKSSLKLYFSEVNDSVLNNASKILNIDKLDIERRLI